MRQKTYIEHITHDNRKPLDNDKQFYNVKCAGMPEKCKRLFIKSVTKDYTDIGDYTKYEQEFIKTPRKLTDFKVGLIVPGKLLPKRIRGGLILVDTTYEMR